MNIANMQMSHDVQNEVYVSAKAANESDTAPLKTAANDRLNELFKVLTPITGEMINAMHSYVEVVDLFVSFFDDVILECALLTDRRAEVEKTLLDLCKEALGKPTEEKARDAKAEHIVATFIDALIIHEAPLDARSRSLAVGLLDNTNPLRLGLTLYKIFCEKYPNNVDKNIYNYFKLEEETRLALITGDTVKATENIGKLFETPINDPEKYLLMSLNSFSNNLIDDAKRVIDIGLKTYPNNKRLQNARDGLSAF
ncbi:MAG: hypothetical protein FWE05_00560 [Defluviitaleaceae bacterium]|nr:hypothetical protein [Defluviitaleaceae bacterium]